MKNVRAILAQLKDELRRAEDIDIDARESMKSLSLEVEDMQGPDNLDIESILDRLKLMETRFAASHPDLERLARELADAIGKMGI